MTADILRDLNRAKVAFQLRAIEAVLTGPDPAARVPELLEKVSASNQRILDHFNQSTGSGQ